MNDLIDRFNSYPLGQKMVLFILVLAGIAVAFYMGVYSPIQQDIASAKNELRQLEQKKEELARLKADQQKVRDKIEALLQRLEFEKEKLPDQAQIPRLLEKIHNQAKTAGLEIEVFQREPEQAQQFYYEIPVAMELVGTFDELAWFFYYVGQMTRIVNVKNITLERAGGKDDMGNGELKVKAKATTFRYRAAEGNKGGAPKK